MQTYPVSDLHLCQYPVSPLLPIERLPEDMVTSDGAVPNLQYSQK